MFWNLELIKEIEKRSGIKIPCSDCLVVCVCEKKCEIYEQQIEGKYYGTLLSIQHQILDESDERWKNAKS